MSLARYSLLFGLASTAALFLSPGLARADEPDPLHRYQDDRLPPPRARGRVLLTGALFTTAFYAPVLGASYLWPDHKGTAQMRIPVVGPWIALGRTQLCSDRPYNPDCSDFIQVLGAVLLAFDGIGQAGGVGIMLQGLFMNTGSREAYRSSLYRSDFSSLTHDRPARPLTFRSGDFELTPVPLVNGQSDLGLAFVGQF